LTGPACAPARVPARTYACITMTGWLYRLHARIARVPPCLNTGEFACPPAGRIACRTNTGGFTGCKACISVAGTLARTLAGNIAGIRTPCGLACVVAARIPAGKVITRTYTCSHTSEVACLAGVYTQIQRFIGATEDLFGIFKEDEEEVTEITEPIDRNELLSGKVVFENVSFAYPGRPQEEVIKNISFEISPNQMVALVGISGSGKTTITSLILRFYSISKGTIWFNGRDSSSYSISSIRRQISLVPQDIFLFGGSIRENIAYGKPGATDAEILNAAGKANAMEFIERFPEGLDTLVGERGAQLSGGQRQRIAIARAVLKDPRILILDEATSSLDSESEKLVQAALENLMKNRTSIVIAHRLSTIRRADRIIVIVDGKIAEEGKHEELLSLRGEYWKLHEMQFENNNDRVVTELS